MKNGSGVSEPRSYPVGNVIFHEKLSIFLCHSSNSGFTETGRISHLVLIINMQWINVIEAISKYDLNGNT